MEFEFIKNGSEKSSEKDHKLKVMDAEMALQNASLAHEYIRLELEKLPSSFHQMELSEKLEDYKKAYFTARKLLSIYNPERLQQLEEQLLNQKQELFTYYSA